MIIEEVRLLNLFSYHGERVFDFRGLSAERNVALVYGRNGYGKTSFLNALRLLFLGPSDEMRAAVQAGRKPTVNQYVLGIAQEWSGIFNRAARQDGATECSVTLVFRETGNSITAKRWWKLIDDDKFESGLSVHLDDDSPPLEGQSASEYLYQQVPRHLVPFFIFDGEQVQQLAEANRKGQLEQIEQVLGLNRRDREIEELTKLIKEWKRQGLAEDEARAMRELERQQGSHEDRLAELQTQLTEAREELAQQKNEIDNLERYLESLRAYTHEKEEAVIKARIGQIRGDLSERLPKLAEELPRDIPLLCNPELVRQGAQLLRELVEDSAGEVAKALQQILDQLPHRLLEEWPLPSPDLTDKQKHFLSQKLDGLVRPYLAPPTSGGGPLRLSREEAARLLAVFQFYERADSLRAQRADELRSLSALKRELEELERKLDDVSSLQEDERQRFRERKADKQRLAEEADKLGEHIRELERQEREIQRQLDEVVRRLAEQVQALKLSQQRQAKVEAAEKLKAFSQRYKQRLKQHYREAIEDAINRHFRVLMTGHHLLSRIVVGEDYGLHYLDTEGSPIGLATISAGMKQLVATALLWALREVSGTQAPVVIDTPLARIDRLNQLNLITRYYPEAAQQVILLPTDSELDREKYALLAPHVYRQYRLDNPTGEDTKPERDAAMYELVEA